MNPDWIIRARVTKKQVKTYKGKDGNPGRILNVDLVDFYGSEIQASMFNDVADKFDSLLQEKKCYIMSKGTIKPANQKFTSIKHDYTIGFSIFSEIREIKDDGDIQEISLTFTPLKSLLSINQETTLDVIGVVNAVQDISEIKLKDGSTKKKRNIELIDNSSSEGIQVQFAIWGDDSLMTFKVGDVVVAKGAKLALWKGGKNLSAGFGGKILVNDAIPHPKYRELKVWFQSHDFSNVTSLSQQVEGGSKRESYRIQTIAEIENRVENDLRMSTNPSVYYNIIAYLSYIKSDENTVYPSCIKCNKKVVKDTQYYNCEKCSEVIENPTFNYSLTTRVEDPTGHLFLRIFSGQALQIMHPTTPKQFNIARVSS
jgi:replication factor A1